MHQECHSTTGDRSEGRGGPAARLTVLLAVLLAGGCATTPDRGTFFEGSQRDLAHATQSVEAHLVHVVWTQRERQQTQTTDMAGVVVSREGHVFVPAELSRGAMSDVRVWTGREEVRAEFVAHDKPLGLSILRVDQARSLEPLPLAAYGELWIGEWFAAVGTAGPDTGFSSDRGLFMLTGRRPARFQEFQVDGIGTLQPGTALVNRHGVPVAVAISPSLVRALDAPFLAALDRFVSEAIAGTSSERKEDETTYFGLCVQPINRDYAAFLDEPESALVVLHVLPDSPAEEAGLRGGDLIVAVDDEPLRLSAPLVRQEFFWRLDQRVGEPFRVTVRRDGETVVCEGVFRAAPEPVRFESKELGLVVRDIDDDAAVHWLLATKDGVVVTNVQRGSPAATSSRIGQPLIERRDVITALAGVPTPTVRAFAEVAEQLRKDRPRVVLVEYWRGRVSGFAALNLSIGSSNDDESGEEIAP